MEEWGSVSEVKGGPVTVPTNIRIGLGNGRIAMGNPGNALTGAFGTSVDVTVRSGGVIIAHPASGGRRHTLRNLAHALVTGVVRNISINCGGRLRMGNMNCHTRGRNGGLILGLNCSRRIVVPRVSNVAVRMPSGASVVVDNTSGRGMNRFTTRIHRGHPPRPCGNGNVGCINRCVHHGRNGTTGNDGGWWEDMFGVISGPGDGGTELGHRTEIHTGVDNATTYPHLSMFHSGDGVCTRLVSSMGNMALTSTTSGRGSFSLGNNGGRKTCGIKRLVTTHTTRGNVARITFSHNNCVFRNHIGRLTRNTHRNNVGFWWKKGAFNCGC